MTVWFERKIYTKKIISKKNHKTKKSDISRFLVFKNQKKTLKPSFHPWE